MKHLRTNLSVKPSGSLLGASLEQQVSQADQQRRRLLEAVLAEALGGRLTAEQESHANVA